MTDPLSGIAARFSKPTVEDDPVVWGKNVLGFDYYSKQREILRLIEFAPKVCVPSCHDAGKSFLAANATARFLSKYPPGTARVVTTAPTNTQVRAILWNEINALHSRAQGKLPGRVNQTEWWIGGYMAGIGRKPSDYAPETFQGLHAEHILIIIDEAGAVPDALWTGVDTLATNAGAHILAIGNPDDPTAEFRRVCDGAEAGTNGWEIVRIPAWETPNLSGEPVSRIMRNSLLAKSWVDDKREKWGEDSALWAAKIAAEFPDASTMTAIRKVDVDAAILGPDAEDVDVPLVFRNHVQLGVDIAASSTGDETVVRERVGNKLKRRWTVQTEEPELIENLIVEAVEQSGASMVHVDATGVGFGFLAGIRRRCPDTAVKPFIAAARADDPAQFENRRAEAHWYAREALRKHQLDLSDMEDPDGKAVDEMTMIRYKLKKGKILVESKDDIRRRTGKSPDDSDAVLLAILPPEGTGGPAPATAHAASKRTAEAEKLATAQAHAASMVTPPPPHAVPERIIPAGSRMQPARRRIRALRARG